MRFGRLMVRSLFACAAYLAAAMACGSALAVESAVFCELPKMNAAKHPNVVGVPTKITLGVFLVDITEIDDVKQQFSVDFVVIQSWNDPRLKGLNGCRFELDQVWSPEFAFVNSGRVFPGFPDRALVGLDGAVRYGQRYRGSLSFRHALHEFPFDKHTIRISMMPVRDVSNAYELVVDEKLISRQDELTILDWTFGVPVGRIVSAAQPVSGGTVDQFDFEIPAQRLYQYYIWKVLLPLILIVAMSWSVFWISPAKFGPQIGMSATSMLTLIAFQFAMASILPRLSYFTLLDWFITAATVYVFLALIESLTTTYLVSMDRLAIALRIDRICRWAFPLAFIFIVSAIFLI